MADIRESFKKSTGKEFTRGNFVKVLAEYKILRCGGGSGGGAYVENSDSTYTNTVTCGGTLVLPDVVHTQSDGTPTPTPAQIPFVCTPASTPLNSSSIFKTGQTISYNTGDDGDTQRGSGSDFYTLDDNNKFGNTNRLTDTLGTQIFTNDWVLDWSNFNQINNTVIGYYRLPQNNGSTLRVEMANQPLTLGGYSDTYICNKLELDNIINNTSANIPYNYAPFNLVESLFSTTVSQIADRNQYIHNNGGWSRQLTTNTTIKWMVMRIFTLAELGL